MFNRYKRAQKKWFEKNVLQFEVYYYDGFSNERIITYDMQEGIKFNWTYTIEGKSLYALMKGHEPWIVFFKCKSKFCKRNDNALYSIRMSYFTIKDLGEL